MTTSHKDIKLVVASHKDYWMPSDRAYKPIWVGAAIRPQSIPAGWLRDDEGETISAKNRSFCELTALYWAWKNLDADYLGLVHYRRHFAERIALDKKGRVASAGYLSRILEKHPVILPVERNYFIESNYSQYAHAHHAHDLDMTRQILAEKYPDYVGAHDANMERTHGHRFNMFVMRRDLLDAYCTWLFDVLFELESRLDTSGYSDYDARVFGFVSERLLDTWIGANGIDYASLPVVNLENQHWIKKGTAFLSRKLRGSAAQPSATALTPPNDDKRDLPLVSVVVPVFNLEDCVEHCLACLQNQTYTNLEMILVDDGSTDASPQILDDFAASEPRARVFHTANAGLSAARNHGIAQAQGELSLYVDGDDIMTSDAVQTLVEAYMRNTVDMVIGTSKIITDYDALDTAANHTVRVMGSQDAQVTLLYGVPGVSAYDKLATTAFWKAHPFPEGHVFEDLRTTFHNVGDCEQVAIVDGPLYGYMMRAGSTTASTTISTQKLDDYLVAIEEVKRCFEGNDDPEVQKALVCRLAHEYTRVYRHLEAHQDEDPRYKDMLATIIDYERAHCFEVVRNKRLGRMPRMRVLLLAGAPKLFTPAYHIATKAAGKRLA